MGGYCQTWTLSMVSVWQNHCFSSYFLESQPHACVRRKFSLSNQRQLEKVKVRFWSRFKKLMKLKQNYYSKQLWKWCEFKLSKSVLPTSELHNFSNRRQTIQFSLFRREHKYHCFVSDNSQGVFLPWSHNMIFLFLLRTLCSSVKTQVQFVNLILISKIGM